MKPALHRLVLVANLIALGAAVLVAGSSATTSGTPFYLLPSSTKECDNVPDCLAVTGPWVIVPTNREATFLVKCPAPHGFLVGGTDARASSPNVRVWFDGQLGAPLGEPNGQNSFDAGLLFHAVTTNGKPGSFEPILGCISLKQLSPRFLDSAPPGTSPGTAPDLRATHVVLQPGARYGPTARGTSVRCLAGERLVGSWTALAYFPPGPPDLSHINAVGIRTVVTRRTVRALIQTQDSLFSAGVRSPRSKSARSASRSRRQFDLHHFSFSSPHYLIALLVVPLLLLFLGIRHRRARYTVAFTNLGVLASVVSVRSSSWRRHVPLFLLVLALVVTAGALARPRIQVTESVQGATIILLVDVSGSMQAADVYPTRLQAAAELMRDLVGQLPRNDRVGLVTLSDNINVLSAPTTDHAAVDHGLDLLRSQGGTALGDGVETAVKLAVSTLATAGIRPTAGSYLPAAVVLASDGGQDRGTISPNAAAAFAKASGVRVYGIVLGTPHGYVLEARHGSLSIRIAVPPDYGSIALFARQSGGQAFHIRTASQLDVVYRKIGSSISRHHQLLEISSWFEIVAALLLVSAVASARVRRAALP